MPAPTLPKLVLLPGLDGGKALFAELMQALSGKVETQFLSYPDHGAQDYATLAGHLVDQLPDDYVLLAESFSGPIAILLAEQARTKPKGIIAAATFARNPFPVFGGILAGALPGLLNSKAVPVLEAVLFRPGDHERTWTLFQEISKLDATTLRQRIKAMTRCDVTKTLARLDVPILYIQGTQDKFVSAAHGMYFAKTASTARMVRIEAPHFVLQYDAEATVRMHILPFLNSVN